MKAANQGGFGVIGILVAVGVVVLGVGAYATLVTPTTTNLASDDFVADPTKSGLENMAENIAQNVTEDVMDVVEGRTNMMKDEMGVEVEMSGETSVDTDTQMPNKPTDQEVSPQPPALAAETTAGTFTDYSPDKLALAEDGTLVLFFRADWCPTCRGLENNINANLSAIPANTHILKLDYDTETELKKKYGVIRQHTLIQVDANGNEIKTLTGLTNTLDQVLNQL